LDTQSLDQLIAEVRSEFDRVYLGGIPGLLTDDGAFLSFVATTTGTEALAGFFAPQLGNGDRFRAFVSRFYPAELRGHATALWELRNAIVHAFHPGPFGLTHHNSRFHLTKTPSGQLILNAEDFYAALVSAARSYFAALASQQDLQTHFLQRVQNPSGGYLQVAAVSAETGSDGAA
jgi:hypothetical protein